MGFFFFFLVRGSIYRSGFKCRKCNKSYSSKDIYLDLTVTAGLRDYTEVKPAGTELFRYFIHFLYLFSRQEITFLEFSQSFVNLSCRIMYDHLLKLRSFVCTWGKISSDLP